jgi:hypothetical protein
MGHLLYRRCAPLLNTDPYTYILTRPRALKPLLEKGAEKVQDFRLLLEQRKAALVRSLLRSLEKR